MRLLSKIGFTVGAAVLLAACANVGKDIEATRGMTPRGDAFQTALYNEYLAAASEEAGEYDFDNAAVWNQKAVAAANAQAVAPDAVADRSIPAADVDEATALRARLLAAFDKTATRKVPADAARAQAMFDCWIEEIEENVQPREIAACHQGLLDTLARIEAALKPAPAAAAPAPAPAAPPALTGPYVIYFDFDSDEVTAAGREVAERAVADARKVKPSVAVVTGNTDRAGNDAYNLDLSRRRAMAVAKVLRKAGMPALINTIYNGEDVPEVPTADGVREGKNRRVVIFFRR